MSPTPRQKMTSPGLFPLTTHNPDDTVPFLHQVTYVTAPTIPQRPAMTNHAPQLRPGQPETSPWPPSPLLHVALRSPLATSTRTNLAPSFPLLHSMVNLVYGANRMCGLEPGLWCTQLIQAVWTKLGGKGFFIPNDQGKDGRGVMRLQGHRSSVGPGALQAGHPENQQRSSGWPKLRKLPVQQRISSADAPPPLPAANPIALPVCRVASGSDNPQNLSARKSWTVDMSGLNGIQKQSTRSISKPAWDARQPHWTTLPLNVKGP
ncbi:hypothetical protein PTTG_27240 [Puccinia triticina 1-1 BBBD Race 1]|uniref:Uncharacterized protein n=2 Tax=Puccinia triticina TaxID=208348 RepID=A0A180GLM0_PUCT1|nr:uncharacterized protein PtA15_7A313 [Puccinia triticina]OAV93656.1 hypothetical protein PTTG_27240 [Puccinia triticina 1-1 BBBD Race 1]WAQ86587.1 hypothetical protein PtA15_7A313 [Puccinia triticina]WAR56447.1 hypothetical protein PtB15_7B296 [Puccinia triticina]